MWRHLKSFLRRLSCSLHMLLFLREEVDSPKYKFQKDEVKAKATKKKYYMNACKLNLRPQVMFTEKHIHICRVRKNLSKKLVEQLALILITVLHSKTG